MSNFNFSGVQVAEEINNSGVKFVEPGYQKLTIIGVEDAKAATGSEGVRVTFESDKGGTFGQNWFFVDAQKQPNKKVQESFQYLVSTFTGQPLSGEANTNSLSAVLVGKSADVTVGGRRYTNEKDGKKYNNVAAELPFGGYAGERTPYIRGNWDSTSEVVVQDDSNKNDDLPF